MPLPTPALRVLVPLWLASAAVACGGASAPPQKPAAPAGATPAASPGPRFTSETTPLYPSDQCKTLIPGEDGSDPTLGCPALPGYEVVIRFSAWATHVEITGPETNVSFGGYLGGEIEWRLADGKPFAVIVSVNPDEERRDDPRSTRLELRGVAGWSIEADVPADAKDAAQAARDQADAAFHKGAPPP
jgi:hypothetical protein